ncbi:hypothetical protein [Nocardia gipuzkoensis]|uniref:hypothetical protein n=1 Tax=Nocardia gipuzkoensis TaxID=2749991 RepID=UPI00237DE3B6|nr:hypothetical protein [Nocardia gipuzkoensis]MDE1672675.1 hypothetical protein [Nocardia gipuzkoensis]
MSEIAWLTRGSYVTMAGNDRKSCSRMEHMSAVVGVMASGSDGFVNDTASLEKG